VQGSRNEEKGNRIQEQGTKNEEHTGKRKDCYELRGNEIRMPWF
jgi:hypothetical protein